MASCYGHARSQWEPFHFFSYHLSPGSSSMTDTFLWMFFNCCQKMLTNTLFCDGRHPKVSSLWLAPKHSPLLGFFRLVSTHFLALHRKLCPQGEKSLSSTKIWLKFLSQREAISFGFWIGRWNFLLYSFSWIPPTAQFIVASRLGPTGLQRLLPVLV